MSYPGPTLGPNGWVVPPIVGTVGNADESLAEAKAAAAQAESARDSAYGTARMFGSVDGPLGGLANTTSGQYFSVPTSAGFTIYKNNAGSAEFVVNGLNENSLKPVVDFIAPQQESVEFDTMIEPGGGVAWLDADYRRLGGVSDKGFHFAAATQLDNANILSQTVGGIELVTLDAEEFALSGFPPFSDVYLDEDYRVVRIVSGDPSPSVSPTKPATSTLRRGELLAAIVSDSRGAASFTTRRSYARGFPYWVEMFSRGAFRFSSDMQFALSGANTDVLLANFAPAAAASAAQIVFILCEVNDSLGTNSVANIQAMIDMMRAAGKLVVVIAECPRGTTANNWSDARRLQHYQSRQAMLRMATQDGVRVVDPYPRLVDPLSTIGAWKAGYSLDQLHFVTESIFVASQVIYEGVKDLAVSSARLFDTVADIYDATNNRTGNLIANGLMAGTSGTKSDSGSTGTVANNWTLAATGSFAAVGTKFVGSDAREWQALQVTSSAIANTGQQLTLTQDINIANIATGDVIECMAELFVEAGSVEAYGPQFELLINGAIYAASGRSDPTVILSPNPAASYGGLIRIERIAVPAGLASMSLRTVVRGEVGKLVSINFRQTAVSVRKVI